MVRGASRRRLMGQDIQTTEEPRRQTLGEGAGWR